MPFASIRAHEGYTQSRRDDLEGLGYTILGLIDSRYDWLQIDEPVSRALHEEYITRKMNFVESNDLPSHL